MAAVRAPGALADAKQLPQRPSEAEERRGSRGLFFSGCRALALQDENILEEAGGDGWAIECRY